jgi:hypothetical protein
MNTTLGQVTDIFVKAVLPLRNALSDTDSFKALLYRMGWKVESIPDSYKSLIQKINEAETLLESLIANESATVALQLLAKAAEIVQSINALSEAPPGIDPAEVTQYLQDLKIDLLHILVNDFLESEFPDTYRTFRLLGIIDTVNIDATSTRADYERINLNFNKIPQIIKDPFSLTSIIYAWNTPDLKFNLLIQHLDDLLSTMNVVSYIDFDNGETLKSLDPSLTSFAPYRLVVPLYLGYIGETPVVLNIEVLQLPARNDTPPGIAVLINVPNDINSSFAITDELSVSFTAENDEKIIVGFTVDPKGYSLVKPSTSSLPGLLQADVGTAIEFKPAAPLSIFSIGSSGGLTLKSAGLSFKMLGEQGKNELVFIFDLKELLFKLDTSEGDGFIKKVIGDRKIESDFGLQVTWSSINGASFSANGEISFSVPAHIELGPVKLDSFNIGIGAKDEAINVFAATNMIVSLGPLTAVIRNIGVSGKFTAKTNNSGNLGPLDVDLGFKPPSGIGLSVDAGGIKGGGILDFNPQKGEYFGALELEFKDMFSLKAFGIINTKLPDGSKGFSLLIVITAEFTPIQLGFGFTLNGVGGLLGVNRTTKVEVLKEGIKTNTLKSILFPEDVVANINRIVSDIKQVFPQQEDHFLICPMGKIGWGSPTIITLELGILIEIPGTGFKILGVLKALLPEEKNPLLKLQVNFLGIIDFENRSISFDASLYDSRILTFTLTGDMALRINFGDKKGLLVSVGGFHPAFKEVPDDLKSMRRITISLYDGEHARIIIQTYFAITSNTAQFGAKAELFAEKGSFNIYGFVSYDVLFQFIPFRFIAEFGAGVALRRHSSVIMSIHVSGQLSGPKPWDAKGEASVSFFFFSVSVPFHVTWGDSNNEATVLKEDILALLQEALNDNRNWHAEIPVNNKLLVSIRTISGSSMAVHPFGIITFSERLVPLEIEIKKYGNKVPKDVNRFEIKVNDTNLKTDEAREEFAPANFFDLKDSDKLSRPSFEPMKSGFKITGSMQLKAPPHIVKKPVDYEFSYLGKIKKPRPDRYIYPGLFFKANTKSAGASQAVLSHQNNRVSLNAPKKIALKEEQYVIANISDMKIFSEELVAGSYTEALQHYNDLIAQKPELKDSVQVLAEYELNTN